MSVAATYPQELLPRWQEILQSLLLATDAEASALLVHVGEGLATIASCGTMAFPPRQDLISSAGQTVILRGVQIGEGSWIGLPVRAPDGGVFGGIVLYSPRPGAFSDAQLRLAAQFGDAVADQLALHAVGNRTEGVEALSRQLQISNQRFRMLVENAMDDFFMHDDKGRFLDVNDRACRNHGYTREEMLQLSATDLSQDLTQEQKEELYRATPPGASAKV